jgi:uncharacterized membrane protein
MDSVWQVAIGVAVGGVLIEIYLLYKQYVRNSKLSGESQKMAKWSVIFGILGLFSFAIGSFIGIILGIASLRKYKSKALSKIGIFVGILTLIPYVLVIVFGP